MVVYGENYMKHINTLCGQSAKFLMLNLVRHVLTTNPYRLGDNLVAPIAEMRPATTLVLFMFGNEEVGCHIFDGI